MIALLALLATVDPLGADRIGVEIRRSPGKGMGAFATIAMKLGDRLGGYDGEILSRREWSARFNGGEMRDDDQEWLESRRRRGVPVTGDYVLGFGENGSIVDAEDPECSSWTRYINHDCNPNLGLFRELDEAGRPFPGFVVIRNCIDIGDELTFDYGPGYWDASNTHPVESAARGSSETPGRS
ncbi:hypothetical protein T492DRAFT_1053992 [Pavlovales sp. CCMP2436]|nr:hypothetical protein T492DRAFT_1053992 [Pavlovales sp. CCMP2436]